MFSEAELSVKKAMAVTGTICAGVDPLLNIGDGHDPPLIGNPDSGYWVDDHPLLYGNNMK